jgi:hypothetical protein
MNERPIEFTQVIDKLEHLALDSDIYYQHRTDGTLDTWYKQLMEIAVADVLLLPIERQARNLMPIEEMDEVDDGMTEVAELLAATFDKAVPAVRDDLLEVIKQFPADDARTALKLRHEGMLN